MSNGDKSLPCVPKYILFNTAGETRKTDKRLKRVIDYFVGDLPGMTTFETMRLRNLVLAVLLMLTLLLFLIPINILAGENTIAGLLPLCGGFSLLSLRLLRKGQLKTASLITTLTGISLISLGIFLSREIPSPAMIYRGSLAFFVLVAAIPLFSPDRSMPLKAGLSALLILQLYYWLRLHTPGGLFPDMFAALHMLAIALPLIGAALGFAVNLNFERLMKDVEERSINLERIIADRTAGLEETAALLRDSESRYRTIIENTHDGIIIVEDDYRISFCNEEILKTAGYSRDEVLGRNFLEFLDPEIRPEIAERYERRRNGEPVPSAYEATLIGKDGRKISGEVRSILFTDHDGRKKSMVQFLDSSTRKETEELLKRQYSLAVTLGSAETLREALDIIMKELRGIEGVDSGGIYILDSVTGTMELVIHWGISRNFMAAVSRLDHNSPSVKMLARDNYPYVRYSEFRDKLSGDMRRLLEDEGLRTLISLPVIGQGRIIAALNCASRTLDEFSLSSIHMLETIAGQVGTLISRLKAEEAVRASEEKYRLLLESSNNLVISMNEEGIVTYISPSIKEISGYEPEEITGRLFLEFIHPDDLPMIMEKYAEVVQGVLSPDEYRIVAKNGDSRWIISNSRPVIEEGQFRGIIGIFTDISWRKHAEEERLDMERRLLHAQKLESLGVLAGGIAHDFNNILMAIMGNLELATTTLPPASAHRTHVDEAMRASRRAADLVRQMLAYSGSGSLVKTEVNLSDIVEETADLLRASISKNARLVLDLNRSIHAVIADPTQIQQIVMNLIVNASEAIGKSEGVITINSGEIECEEAYLRSSCLEVKPPAGRYAFLEVRDTGSGMDNQTLCKIFDPFFTTKFAGRGLGLAAVLGIVRSHGGAIMVSSTPGKGTSIRVILPLTESMAGTVIPDEDSPDKTIGEKPAGTIIVIDDDEMILQTASAMLERLGFYVLTASSGREGIEVARQRADEIDCALVDLTMQGMNGRDTITELKRIQPGIKTILSSGYHRDDVMESMGNEYPDGFIQKPYRLKDLEEEISRITMIKK